MSYTLRVNCTQSSIDNDTGEETDKKTYVITYEFTDKITYSLNLAGGSAWSVIPFGSYAEFYALRISNDSDTCEIKVNGIATALTNVGEILMISRITELQIRNVDTDNSNTANITVELYAL